MLYSPRNWLFMLLYSVFSSRSNLINALSILYCPEPPQPLISIPRTSISPTLQRRGSHSPGILCFSLGPRTNGKMSAINSLYGFLTNLLSRFFTNLGERVLNYVLRRVVRTWCPSWEELLLGLANDRTRADCETKQSSTFLPVVSISLLIILFSLLVIYLVIGKRHDARQPPHARRPNQDRRPKLSRADREIAQQQKHLVISRKPELRPRAENA